MNNEKLVINWHNSIIRECQKRLGRNLTDEEEIFITSRGGFVALEMIEDTVKTLAGKELEEYLNSESIK
ncbi:MAG: hypothetical protein ABSA09_06670 [Desulfobaccales bacterium]|jgi:microsomal dipeptidase-like Zn-dependent dipeptidase